MELAMYPLTMNLQQTLWLLRYDGELRCGWVRRRMGELRLPGWAPRRLRSLSLRLPQIRVVRYAVTDPRVAHANTPLLGEGFLFQYARLAHPHGVACGPDGRLAVADSGKHRVLLLAADGRLVRRLHHADEGRVPLSFPTSVAFAADGTLLVLNSGAGALHRYDSRGNYSGDPPGLPGAMLLGARGLAAGSGGALFVCATRHGRVYALDAAGWPHPLLGESELIRYPFAAPVAIAQAADGRIAVCDAGHHRVEFFDAAGVHLRSLGALGEGPGRFNAPGSCAFTDRGDLLVLEREGNRLQVLRPDGSVAAIWGRRGSWLLGNKAGELSRPAAIAVDPERCQVLIADTDNHRLQRIDLEQVLAGRLPFWMQTRTAASDLTQRPRRARRSPALAVVSMRSLRLAAPLHSPHGLTRIGPEHVWIADTGNHRLLRYSPKTERSEIWGRLGRGTGEFINPTDAAPVEDEVYVVDSLNSRVQRLHPAGSWLGEVKELQDLEYPRSISYEPRSGLLAVAETLCGRLRVYDRALHLRWGLCGRADGVAAPAWVRWHRSELYVADSSLHRVVVFGRDGTLIRSWGRLGEGAEDLNRPQALAFIDDRYCVVADAGNHRLQFFTLRGEWLCSWRRGDALSPPLHPRGLVWDRENRELLVADARRPTLLLLRLEAVTRSRLEPSRAPRGAVLAKSGVE
jgi:sugar lactone lactonase YvrE